MITPETLQYFKEKLEKGQDLTKREMIVVITQLMTIINSSEASNSSLQEQIDTLTDDLAALDARVVVLESA